MSERPPKPFKAPPGGNRPPASTDKKSGEIVCLCNEITRGQIETAIKNGCDSLNKIFDCTTAGVGPCGGSCRRYLGPMLDEYLATGAFSEDPIRPVKPKKPRGR